MPSFNLVRLPILTGLLQSFCLFVILNIGVDARRYKAHDRIGLVANTVGPFNNPTETYPVRKYLLIKFLLYADR